MTSSAGGVLKNNPVLSRLGQAARGYAAARSADAVKKLGQRVGGVTDSLHGKAEGGGFKAAAAGTAVRRLVEGQSPFRAALGGIGAGLKEKIKGIFGRKKGAGAGAKKFMNIVEDVTIGVPVDVAYNQWTQFQEFSNFMKGVEGVDPTDEVNSNWRMKVFKSRRSWKASVTEQIPDRRIAWTSEGAKGTSKGVVTFHPLADDLTQVLLVLEYYPKGLFEKTGNIWRAQGRRARLDLKHFRRFIMLRGEETGSWRGEIRDGEVVRSHEDAVREEEEGRPELERGEEEAPEEAASEETREEPEEGEEEPYEEEGEEEPEPEPVRAERPRRRAPRPEPAGAQ